MTDNMPPTPPKPPVNQAPPVPDPYAARASTQPYAPVPAPAGQKSFVTTWLLALLVGLFGIDRFYLGKVGTGILKLITFGGLGIWALVDLILVLTGATRDKNGQRLAGYDESKKVAWIVTGALIVVSIIFSSVNGAAASRTAGSRVENAGVAAPAATAGTETTGAGAAGTGATDAAASAAPAEAAPAEASSAPTPAENTAKSWADDTFGTFAPVTQEGTGDSIVTLPTGATAGIVTATHSGERNFAISVLDAENQSTAELLVNTIGTYTGTTAYGFNALGDGVSLQVTADGAWSITISPVSAAPDLISSGTGDAVYLYNGKTTKLTATHDGERNFVVTEETGKAFSYGLLVNTIGAYSGTVPLSSGPSVLTVGADGGWTLQVG